MNSMGNKIRELRKAKHLTLEQLGDLVGVGKSTVRKWEVGIIENMRREKVAKLADVLGTTPMYLMGLTDEPSNLVTMGITSFSDLKKQMIPIIGEIACGEPIYANETYGEYVLSDTNADMALICKGNSMIGAGINDGDLVFIRKQPSVDLGEIAAVIIDDEATLKKVYYYPDQKKLVLLPENPAFEPLIYNGEELSHVRLLGKAVALQRKL